MEQHRLKEGPLLDEKGNLVEAGYATSLVKTYSREAIKAKASRIKEWDYYYIGNKDYGIALTIADNSYMAMASITYLDFRSARPFDITKSPIEWGTFGKLKLPSTSKAGDLVYERKGFSISFRHEEGKRRIVARMENFGKKGQTFHCDVLLEPTTEESMVIATPWKKEGHFYYNQKINALKASGYAKIGNTYLDFNKDSFAVLDWGRGVWTYKNTWYWASCSSMSKGHLVSFNLGYGFGDTSNASENMVFYDGKAYKLDDVRMDIPLTSMGKDDYLSPWNFRSQDGAIKLTFTPVYNRHSDTNALLIRSKQNQVFGTYTGTIRVGETIIEFDACPGFAEKVYNRW